MAASLRFQERNQRTGNPVISGRMPLEETEYSSDRFGL